MTDERTLERACPLCERDNREASVHTHSEPPYRLKRCRACGMVYLENAPTYEAVASDFAWDKTRDVLRRRRRESQRLHYMLSHGSRVVRKRLRLLGGRRRERRLIERYIGAGRVLEVGCSRGKTLRVMPRNIRPYAIEISPALAAQAQRLCEERGGRVVCAPALEGLERFEQAFFDGIVMRAYLEHEAKPRAVLERSHRVLRPGGRLIIKVPNYASLNRIVARRQWRGYRFPDHVNYFTPRTLIEMVEASGYRVLRFDVLDRFPLSDNMWMVAEKPALAMPVAAPNATGRRRAGAALKPNIPLAARGGVWKTLLATAAVAAAVATVMALSGCGDGGSAAAARSAAMAETSAGAGTATGHTADSDATAAGGSAQAGEEGSQPMQSDRIEKIEKTDAQWRQQLTPEQHRVLREEGTERAYSGAYWDAKTEGTYACAGCGLPLYSSKTKYDSRTGWPSFWEPIDPAHIGTRTDRSFFMVRTEVHCARCGGHLGHIFDDGPPPTGKRHCINSAALKLVRASDQDIRGQAEGSDTSSD